MRRYHRLYHHPFIYYRRPHLVTACCAVTLIYSSIYSPLLMLHHAFIDELGLSISSKTTFLVHTVPLLVISLHFSIRFYQVFYDLNYNSAIVDEIWSKAINSKTDNFWKHNRSRYGRPRFLYFCFVGSTAVISVFVVSLTLGLDARFLWIAQCLVLSVWILNVIPMLFIFQKLTSFLDHIKIRTELLANLILSVVGIAVLSAYTFVHLLIDSESAGSAAYKEFEYLVLNVVICSIYFCICYVMTLYIIMQPQAQCRTQSVSSNASAHRLGAADAPQSVPEIASKMANHSYSVHRLPRSPSAHDLAADRKVNLTTIRMHHIFGHEHAFKLFIRHLAKEYSVENALFLFESQQFKRHFSSIQGDLSIAIPMTMHPAVESRATNSISISTSKHAHASQRRPKSISVPLTVQEEAVAVRDSSSIFDRDTETPSIDTPNDATLNITAPHSETADGVLADVISPSETAFEDADGTGRQRDSHIMCFNAANMMSTAPRTAVAVTPRSVHGAQSVTRYSQSVQSMMGSPRTHKLRTVSANHYEGHFMVLDFMPFGLIPQSAIVEQCGNDMELMFLKIYEKYIDWKHSSFEINISHSVRQKMHDIYVRITYQLLVDERKQILMEERVTRDSEKGMATLNETGTTTMNGHDGARPSHIADDPTDRTSGLWQSRKTVVNTLKATISKRQIGTVSGHGNQDSDSKTTDAEQEQMGTVVEDQEMIDALTMAESDIMRNLNDSLTRFRRTPELHQLIVENAELFTS